MSTIDRISHPDHDLDATVDKHVLPTAGGYALGVLRIAFGFYFLWAFLDKVFGLGFSTPGERAWINGGSPTTGYLSGVEGPLAGFYNSLAGVGIIDWLFMLGLLGIGLALVSGAALRIAAVAGALMYGLMYLAALPLENNPVVDDHLTGAVVVVLLALAYAGDTWGLGNWWKQTAIVKRFPFLR